MPVHPPEIHELEAKKHVDVKLGPRGGMFIEFTYFRKFVTFVPILMSQGKTAEQIWEFVYKTTWNPRKKEGLEQRHNDIVIAIDEARRE